MALNPFAMKFSNSSSDYMKYTLPIAVLVLSLLLFGCVSGLHREIGGIKEDFFGDYAGAIKEFDAAIQADPGNKMAYFGRGNAKHALGDYSGAIADYGEAIRIDPNFASAYLNRGASKDGAGDYRGAIQDDDKALSLLLDSDSSKAMAYSNRGSSKRHLGDYSGAKKDYESTLQLDPQNKEVHANLAGTLVLLGEYNESIREASAAIKIEPNNAGLYYLRGLGKLYAGNYSGSLEDFNATLGFARQSTGGTDSVPDELVYGKRGVANTKLGNYAQAIPDLDRAIAANTNDTAQFLFWRGYARIKSGNENGGMDDIAAALIAYNETESPEFAAAMAKLNLTAPDLYNRLGIALGKSGNYGRAIEAYDKAIALAAENDSASAYYYNRGNSRRDSGDLAGAKQDFETAVRLKSSNLNARFNLAGMLGMLGEYKASVEEYDIVIKLMPDNAGLYYGRALSKSHVNDTEGTIGDLGMSLQIARKQLKSPNCNSNCSAGLQSTIYSAMSMGRQITGNSSWGSEGFGNATALDKSSYEDYIRLAQKLSDSNNYSGAVEAYDKAILLVDYAGDYWARGIAKDRAGDFSGAIADYTVAAKSEDMITSGLGHINRGETLLHIGNYTDAIADFDLVLEREPGQQPAYVYRGRAKAGLGDYSGAIADYNSALGIYPQDAYAYHYRAIANERLGNSGAAQADNEKAAEFGFEVSENWWQN